MILFEFTTLALDHYFRAVAMKRKNPEACLRDDEIERLRVKAEARLKANGAKKVTLNADGASYETPRNRRREAVPNPHA